MTPVGPAAVPWTMSDLARLARYQGVSIVAIVVCFAGADNTSGYNGRLFWIVGAFAAMLVSGLGWVTWLLVATQALRRRQRRLAVAHAVIREAVAPAAAEPEIVAVGGLPVTGARMTHYHRPGCLLTAGREVSAAPAAEHAGRGLSPCRVCEP